MNPGSLLNQSMQPFSEFWAARDTRERMMIAVAAIVAALGLTFSLLIAPALAGREQLGKSMPELRQQVAHMQAMSKEAAEISGTPAPPMAAISKESIEAALARKGLKAQSVIIADGRIKVQLAAVSFADTLGWLDDMQKTAFLSVTDADIVALPQADKIDATLILHQQRNE